MGGRRKGKGAFNKPEEKGIDTGRRLYPVSDADVDIIRKSMRDNSQITTKAEPDGMGKDSTAAIKEFLKKQ